MPISIGARLSCGGLPSYHGVVCASRKMYVGTFNAQGLSGSVSERRKVRLLLHQSVHTDRGRPPHLQPIIIQDDLWD